jgi:hypothetical protein
MTVTWSRADESRRKEGRRASSRIRRRDARFDSSCSPLLLPLLPLPCPPFSPRSNTPATLLISTRERPLRQPRWTRTRSCSSCLRTSTAQSLTTSLPPPSSHALRSCPAQTVHSLGPRPSLYSLSTHPHIPPMRLRARARAPLDGPRYPHRFGTAHR